jgi:hypothetical protein
MVTPPSPPVDFPLHGLDDSWQGDRCLAFFDAKVGDPTWGVRLVHQDPAGDAYVGVASLPRERDDRVFADTVADRLTEVAHYGTHWLINLTLPEMTVPRRDGFLRALVGHSLHHAVSHARWPEVTWSVDGTQVPAAAWRFAGGWTAFTDALPDTYLVVVGLGREPDGLALAVVEDATPYGFDLTAPLRLSDTHDRGPLSRPDQFHADHTALITG